MGVDVGEDQVHVLVVLQDDVVEDLQGELGELHAVLGDVLRTAAGPPASMRLATPPGRPNTGWIDLAAELG